MCRLAEEVERVREAGKPTVVWYVTDWDPAGRGSMPVALCHKIEWFLRQPENRDLQLTVVHVALTDEQVERYQLPRSPIKESEKRADAFEERFGAGAVELDAAATS